jgi:hypothetical protein
MQRLSGKPPVGYLFALRQEMENQMPDVLGKGIIQEIDSPWSSPAILVPKKSLDGTQQW